RQLPDALTRLVPLAAQRPSVLLVGRIRIGEKREFAGRYLRNEERLGGVGLHEKRQLVHSLLLANPGQQPGLLHGIDEFAQALLRHLSAALHRVLVRSGLRRLSAVARAAAVTRTRGE